MRRRIGLAWKRSRRGLLSRRRAPRKSERAGVAEQSTSGRRVHRAHAAAAVSVTVSCRSFLENLAAVEAGSTRHWSGASATTASLPAVAPVREMRTRRSETSSATSARVAAGSTPARSCHRRRPSGLASISRSSYAAPLTPSRGSGAASRDDDGIPSVPEVSPVFVVAASSSARGVAKAVGVVLFWAAQKPRLNDRGGGGGNDDGSSVAAPSSAEPPGGGGGCAAALVVVVLLFCFFFAAVAAARRRASAAAKVSPSAGSPGKASLEAKSCSASRVASASSSRAVRRDARTAP
mmetsp:Transcript_16509/g.66676  ORF Transcript_16509/g.66676 Transcript_16509/m.66676 type:complete len:293 (+) Transcript_16509:183-1061(+)